MQSHLQVTSSLELIRTWHARCLAASASQSVSQVIPTQPCIQTKAIRTDANRCLVSRYYCTYTTRRGAICLFTFTRYVHDRVSHLLSISVLTSLVDQRKQKSNHASRSSIGSIDHAGVGREGKMGWFFRFQTTHDDMQVSLLRQRVKNTCSMLETALERIFLINVFLYKNEVVFLFV